MQLPEKETIRKILLITLSAVIFGVIVLFFLRGPIFSHFLYKKTDTLGRSWHARISIGSARLTGLSSVIMTRISLAPEQGDTLLRIDSLYASVSLWKLMTGRIALTEVAQKNTRLTLVRRDSLTNYMFLLSHGEKKTAGDTVEGKNYAERVSRLLEAVFDLVPSTLRIYNLEVSDDFNGHLVEIGLDALEVLDHTFLTHIRIREDSVREEWIASGSLDKGDRRALVKVYPKEGAKGFIPYIRYRWNAGVSFDTLAFTIAENNEDTAEAVSGSAFISGLTVKQERIATDTVRFGRMGVRYHLRFGHDYIELDSNTQVLFNRLEFRPYIRYHSAATKEITLSLHKPPFPAQDLFSSFPPGLFTTLEGIKVSGNLSFHMDLFVDLSLPDSLRFDCALERHNFRVLSYGNADLAKINGPFLYTAYEKGVPVRTFEVGPGNPNFRTLDQISHYLQVSVLNSEDGAFFQHRGFMPDAFREAMAQDIRERRFARGGSTISMQLVKNVFLSRNKTIGRKVEEMMLTWLLENQGITTKERMYEVYLNVIEWGPLVYGANEGARFYFNKDASKLTLAEAIFMASIIPRPKWFRYSFDTTGHLSENQAGFYRLLSEKMLRKGQITQADYDHLVPDVDLKGPAKEWLKRRDTLRAVADSLSYLPE